MFRTGGKESYFAVCIDPLANILRTMSERGDSLVRGYKKSARKYNSIEKFATDQKMVSVIDEESDYLSLYFENFCSMTQMFLNASNYVLVIEECQNLY
jgi:hypothetical protein